MEAKLKEVLDLMTARHHRDRVDEALAVARERRERSVRDRQPIYHHTASGHHAATTMQTKAALDLAEQIKLRIQLGQYTRELDATLERLSERYLAVLERQLGHSRY